MKVNILSCVCAIFHFCFFFFMEEMSHRCAIFVLIFHGNYANHPVIHQLSVFMLYIIWCKILMKSKDGLCVFVSKANSTKDLPNCLYVRLYRFLLDVDVIFPPCTLHDIVTLKVLSSFWVLALRKVISGFSSMEKKTFYLNSSIFYVKSF